MKRTLVVALAGSMIVAVAPAYTEDAAVDPFPPAGRWRLDAVSSSAGFAQAGWSLIGTTGLSWPDGRQAVITFWRSSRTVRCIDYFDRDMVATGRKCEWAAPAE